MKKIIATLIAASFLGLGSLSFAEEKSAAPAKEKPAALKPKPGTVGSIKDKPTAVKPTSPADANPDVKPPAGAVQDGAEKPKPKPILIIDPIPRPERKPFPPHWGEPPEKQTRDLRPLPGDFGMGSGTLARWIEENLQADKKGEKPGEGTEKPKPKPEVKPKPRPNTQFGQWLDDDGFVLPGPKTADWIDTDDDGTDDRVQRKPGGPGGKLRPTKPGEKPGEKPETGGPDPKPEKPGEKPGGGKPGGQLGGGPNVHPKPPAPFRPKNPPRPELPDDLQDQVDLYKAAQDTLRDGLKTAIDALGDDATREDVKAVAEAFKAENKAAIEAQIAAGKALHEAIKANRPKRGEIERPEPPEEVKAKADAMRAIHKTLGDARHDLHKALKDVSDEDRKALIAAFKDAQKEHHAELKEAKKALREAIRDNAETGDRRSED